MADVLVPGTGLSRITGTIALADVNGRVEFDFGADLGRGSAQGWRGRVRGAVPRPIGVGTRDTNPCAAAELTDARGRRAAALDFRLAARTGGRAENSLRGSRHDHLTQ